MSSWRTIKLGDATRRIGGGTPSRKEPSYWGGDLPWFTVADLEDLDDIQELTTSRECITRKGLKNSAAKLVPNGAIVFSSRVVVGKVGIAKNELVTNQDFSSFVPINSIDTEFLAYFLIKAKVDLRGHQRGATIKGVTTRVLDSIDVPYPRFMEQRRMVARIRECMERVEEIEALRIESIEKANAALPSMLNEAFLDLSETYETGQITDVALETRYGTSRRCSSTPDGTAILRIPNVAGGFVNFHDLKYCLLDGKERQKISLETGDLLFVRTNGSRDLVGRCAIYEGNGEDQDYGFASYLIRVRLNQDKMRPHFLALFLSSTQGRAELDKRRRTSAGQFNINSENLRNIDIPLPPLHVQDRLVEALRDQQAQVIRLQNELRSAKEAESHLRESILHKAFAGEL